MKKLPSGLFPPSKPSRGSLHEEDWPGGTCRVSHADPGGLGLWAAHHPGAQGRNSYWKQWVQLRDCSLQSGEAAWPPDSFHRNWENNLVWFSLLVLEDSKIHVSANRMSWRPAGWPLAVSTCLFSEWTHSFLPGPVRPASGHPLCGSRWWVWVAAISDFHWFLLLNVCKWHFIKRKL